MGLASLTGAAQLVLALAVFAVALRAEGAGRRLTALHVVVLILVLDTSLFPTGGTSTGVFVLPVNDRTTGVLFLLIPLLLLRRWLTGNARLRFTVTGMAWTAFFSWLLVEFLVGRANGNSTSDAIQEAKVIVMLGGAAMVAAGVEARDLVGRRGIPLMTTWAAPIAAIVTASSLAGFHSNADFGLFHGVSTGDMGADAASVFASLGLLGLAIALASPQRHRRGLIASGILLVAPVFTGQRASLLGLLAGCALLAVYPLLSRRHRVVRVTPQEAVSIGLSVLAVAGVLALASATGHGYDAKNSQVATSFTSAGKADSAQSRINQWKGARTLISERPILGWGLGKEFLRLEKIEDAPLIPAYNDLSHDIFLDVTVRAGLVGLAFLVVALLSSFATGLRGGRRVSPRIAALGLGASAVIVEMVVRGTVESIFEKERLSVVLGLAVGMACSAGRATGLRTETSSLAAAPLVVPLDWYPQDDAVLPGHPQLVSTGSFPQKNT